jgi:hypothetical protein
MSRNHKRRKNHKGSGKDPWNKKLAYHCTGTAHQGYERKGSNTGKSFAFFTLAFNADYKTEHQRDAKPLEKYG